LVFATPCLARPIMGGKRVGIHLSRSTLCRCITAGNIGLGVLLPLDPRGGGDRDRPILGAGAEVQALGPCGGACGRRTQKQRSETNAAPAATARKTAGAIAVIPIWHAPPWSQPFCCAPGFRGGVWYPVAALGPPRGFQPACHEIVLPARRP